MMEETWKAVVGYEGLYDVSDLGRVRSLNYNRTGSVHLLKEVVGSGMYPSVNLCKAGNAKQDRVHSLVAKSFLDPDYLSKGLVVNHKDFNRQNNVLSNLEIVTYRDNTNLKHLPSTSKYTGVSWNRGKWTSHILVNRKLLYLGAFNTEIEASKYYEDALICINEGRIDDIIVKRIESKCYCFNKWANKWVSYTIENGKMKHLGLFKTEEEACFASQEAKKKIKVTGKGNSKYWQQVKKIEEL